MKGVIDIESRPFSETQWYAGTYTVPTDDEQGDIEYQFTVCIDTNEHAHITETIHWLEGSPGEDDIETEDIEQDILEQFNQQI